MTSVKSQDFTLVLSNPTQELQENMPVSVLLGPTMSHAGTLTEIYALSLSVPTEQTLL
jgi:hypothetical protein